MPASAQQRAWLFTVNNPDRPFDDPCYWLKALPRYAVFQLERGENGTVHYQGYVLFNGRGKTLAGCKRLHGRAHWEVRRGTHGEAEAYCSKDDTRIAPTERIGEPPADGGSGARSDLLSVKRRLDEGAGDAAIADEFFGQWCRYGRAFQTYRALKRPARNDITYTKVYWGLPGVGKTRLIAEAVSEDAYWLPKPNGTRVFWDGYEGQADVVIDEFFGWMPRDLMCRLCDRYPFRVETKGGSVPFTSSRIFISSNAPPNAWWPRVGLGPMRRRLQGDHGRVYQMLEDHSLVEGSGLEAIVPAVAGDVLHLE